MQKNSAAEKPSSRSSFQKSIFLPDGETIQKMADFYIRVDSRVHRKVRYPEVSEWFTDEERAGYVLHAG